MEAAIAKALAERLNEISPGKWKGRTDMLRLMSLYRKFVVVPGFEPEFVDGVATITDRYWVTPWREYQFVHHVTVEEWIECKKHARIWSPSK